MDHHRNKCQSWSRKSYLVLSALSLRLFTISTSSLVALSMASMLVSPSIVSMICFPRSKISSGVNEMDMASTSSTTWRMKLHSIYRTESNDECPMRIWGWAICVYKEYSYFFFLFLDKGNRSHIEGTCCTNRSSLERDMDLCENAVEISVSKCL